MKLSITSSLIITTYNWHKSLELVLESVKNQSVYPSEVVIADDGSTKDTKELIDRFKQNFPIKLSHIWHEDMGFRRSAILNLAIAQTNNEYVIQVDGDCILHKYFVEDHLKQVEKNTFLYGSRVNIQENFLTTLFNNKTTEFRFFSKGIKNRTRNLHIPFLSNHFKRKNELSNKIRGCNLSYWRKDFCEVNGYNEDMEGWGREDSELIVRLLNNKVLGKRVRYSAILYHIPHKEKSKIQLDQNSKIQTESILQKKIWCENGMDKYLKLKKI